MKIYKITVQDDLAATIDRMAEAENRTPSEFIAIMLRDWAFGVARRYQPITQDELAEYRARREPRITLKAKDRNTIFERDGATCHHCHGPLVYNQPWHIDHLMPLAKGGGNDLANLVASCVRCNVEKKDKILPAVAQA